MNHQSADDSDDIFEENVIPKVSLKTPENTTALYPTYDEPLESDNDGLEDELARQFAAQEQARMQEMEVRAKASNAEDALKVILNEPTASPVKAREIYTENTDEITYKPYSDTLIHPAFQQPTNKREKPTTPLPSLDLLEHRPTQAQDITRKEILDTSARIEQQLKNFNVKATVQDVLVGPVVTRYELELQPV